MERYKMFLDWKKQYHENDYTPKGNLQIECNPIKLPMAFFKGLKFLKFLWKYKRPWIVTTILKKNGAGGIRLPILQRYSGWNKIVWYRYKNRHID